MSPLQLNNATTGYKNTLRECKTVGQRKTNILRNIISLFCCPTAFHARQQFVVVPCDLCRRPIDLLAYWPAEEAGGAYA